MHLSKTDAEMLVRNWLEAWCRHDLEGVLAVLHDNIEFENWSGFTIQGKHHLREAWAPWFRDHGDFLFTEEDLFIDESAQKALLSWRLDWPTPEKAFRGQRELRRGVDILHFRDGKIHKKSSYTKTTVQIAGRSFPMRTSI
jgi:ketosteroid isomerase-like protein